MKPRATGARLLDFFLPPACIACGAHIPARSTMKLLCAGCRSRLRPPPSPRCGRCDYPLGTGERPGRPCLQCLSWPASLTRARSAYALRAPAEKIVHALKYGGWRELGPWMAGRMARRLLDSPAERGRAVVVPVPTSAARRRRRGYDQAEVLARALAQRVVAPCVLGLSRESAGRTQVSLHPEQRLANVQDAFTLQPRERHRLRGADVVLVDDVLTTGATARAAAQTLAAAGARTVALITFARALPNHGEAHDARPVSPRRA